MKAKNNSKCKYLAEISKSETSFHALKDRVKLRILWGLAISSPWETFVLE